MTDFLWLLADDIVNISPFAILCAYPFRNSFRFSPKKTVLLTALVILGISVIDAAIGVCISAVIPSDKPIYTQLSLIFSCLLILCPVWYFYAVKGVWQKKAFVFLFAMTSAMFITSIANCILNALPNKENRLPADGYTIMSSLAACVLAVPLLCLFLKFFYMPVEQSMSAKESGYLCIPLAVLMVILAVVFSFMDYVDIITNPATFLLYLGLLLSVMVLYGVIFRMYRLSYERYTSNEKYLETRRQINIRDEQYRRICENIDSVRRQRHDLRHHMLLLSDFLENGDTEKAREYLRQYLEYSKSLKITKYCDNPVVNMLVSHYGEIAKERGVDFSARIQIPAKLPIHDIDLSVLLGNLLENAVDASQWAPETKRVIKLNMILSGKMIAITVDNGFDGIIKQCGEKYLSTKSEHRGLGLSSLADIAEKYGGGTEFRHEENMFYSSIMLCIRQPRIS